jgi:GT2 family glycosyltransferase
MKEVLIAMAVHDLKDSGRTQLTDRTLKSLLQTVDFNRHQLYIVDNASCEETHAIFKKFSHEFTTRFNPSNLTILWNEENYGTAKAVNKAWFHRKPGQHCVKIDNDVEIHQSGWVDLMMECADRSPQLGQIGLKRKDCWEYPTHPDAGLRSQLMMLPHAPGETWLVVEAVNHVMGTCVLHTSALLDKVGYLYQPSLYGWDDVLMSQRSHLAGFWNVFIPSVPIDHIDPGGTNYQDWKQATAGKDMSEMERLQKAYADGSRSIYEQL